MSNLPQNSEYSTPGNADISSAITSHIGTFLRGRGVPYGSGQNAQMSDTMAQSGTMLRQFGESQGQNNAIAWPFMESQAPTGANIQIPQDYSGFQPTGGVPGTNYNWQTPTQPVIKNMGQNIRDIVPGQYVKDLSNPNALVKSVRGYTPAENKAILAGRDPRLYQIDHIIPLSLGGADTMGNREVLTIADNDMKTKAQAVPYTLYSHGLISLNEARIMSADWKHRDVSDIPEPDNVGLIPVNVARSVQQRWADDPRTKDEKWKDFWSSIPESTKNFGEGWLPDPLREFIKGFGSGATLGFLPYEQGAHEENSPQIGIPGIGTVSVDRAAGAAGQMAGGVASFMLGGEVLAGVAGIGGRMIPGLARLGTAAATEAGLTAATAAAAAEAGGTTFGVSDMAAQTYMQAIKNSWNNPAIWNSARNFAIQNAVMGQANQLIQNHFNPDIFAGKQEARSEENPVAHILTDLAMGYAAGIVPPSMKSGVLPAFVPGRAQSAVFAMAPITAGTFFLNPEDPVGALTNGAIFGALHLAGGAGIMSAGKKRETLAALEASQARAYEFATDSAKTILGHYDPTAFKSTNAVVKGAPKPTTALSAAEIETIEKRAVNGLWERFYFDKAPDGSPAGGMTLDSANKELARIRSAAAWMKADTLDPVAKQQYLTQMLQNMVGKQRSGRLQEALQFGRPGIATQAANNLDDTLLRDSFNKHNFETPSGQYPVGDLALTGAGIDMNTPQAQYFFRQKAAGKASPSVLLISRPDTAPVWRQKNDLISEEQIKNGSYERDTNPENALQAFGIVLDEAGNKQLIPLGWVASDFRLNRATNAEHLAFNQHPGVIEGNMSPISLHKDTIATAMRQGDIKVLIANLDYRATGATKESGLPFIPLNINDQNWEYSKLLGEKLSSLPSKNTLQQNIADVNTALNAKAKSAAIAKIQDQVQAPASETLPMPPTPKAEADTTPARVKVDLPSATTKDVLATIEDALRSPNPREIQTAFKDRLGVFLTAEQSKSLYTSRNDLTVRDVLNVIADAVENGATDGRLGMVIDGFVKPYLEGDVFRASNMARVFPDLKLLGGLESRARAPKGQQQLPLLSDAEAKALRKQGYDEATIARVNDRGTERPPSDVTDYRTQTQGAPQEQTTVPKIEPLKYKTDMAGGGAIEDRIVAGAAATPPKAPEKSVSLLDPLPGYENAGENIGQPQKWEVQRAKAFAEAEQTGKRVQTRESYGSFGNNDESRSPEHAKDLFRKATGINEVANPAITKIAEAGTDTPMPLPAVTGPRAYGEMKPAEVPATEALKFIDDGLSQPKDSPAYAHATALDTVLKHIYGKNYKTNPEAQKLMSDQSFWNNVFAKETNIDGREQTQPKGILEAMASGDKAEMSKAISARRDQVRNWARGAEEKSDAPTIEMTDFVRPDIQDEGLVHDLTYGESRLMPGIASEKEMTSAQAIRDVKTLFLGTGKTAPGLLKYINDKRASIGQKKVSLPMEMFRHLEARAKATDKARVENAKVPQDAEEQLVDLGKRYTALTKALQAAPDTDLQAALEDVASAIEKYSKLAGKSGAQQ